METKELKRTTSRRFPSSILKSNSDTEELYVNRFPKNALSRENKIRNSIQTLIENRTELISHTDPFDGPRRIRAHSHINFEICKIVSYSQNLKILKKLKSEVIICRLQP